MPELGAGRLRLDRASILRRLGRCVAVIVLGGLIPATYYAFGVAPTHREAISLMEQIQRTTIDAIEKRKPPLRENAGLGRLHNLAHMQLRLARAKADAGGSWIDAFRITAYEEIDANTDSKLESLASRAEPRFRILQILTLGVGAISTIALVVAVMGFGIRGKFLSILVSAGCGALWGVVLAHIAAVGLPRWPEPMRELALLGAALGACAGAVIALRDRR